jgi:hypothetical protein
MSLDESLGAAVRTVGGWCEVAASLGVSCGAVAEQ